MVLSILDFDVFCKEPQKHSTTNPLEIYELHNSKDHYMSHMTYHNHILHLLLHDNLHKLKKIIIIKIIINIFEI